MISFLVK